MTPALGFAINVIGCIWWAPTILLFAGRFACRHAYWRVRLLRVKVLRMTGHLDAAKRALDRLAADTERCDALR